MVVPDSIIMALIFGATWWSQKNDELEPHSWTVSQVASVHENIINHVKINRV